MTMIKSERLRNPRLPAGALRRGAALAVLACAVLGAARSPAQQVVPPANDAFTNAQMIVDTRNALKTHGQDHPKVVRL